MQSSTNRTDHQGPSIAVDFGATKISAARISQNQIIERKQVATDQRATPERHLETIIELAESLGIEEHTSIGVAVCGRVDTQGHWHTLNNNTLREFSSFPLRERLEVHFRCPVTVMNDAVAAAWGEYSLLADKQNIDAFLYVTVSTGVGGGIILNGRPLQSASGLAGHIGFMTSSLGNEQCGSGRFATIESVASGTAIGRIASAGSEKNLTGYDVFQAHLSNDKAATAIVNTSAKAIAGMIADVRALIDVQLVAIGGSVGLAEGYIALVQHYLDEEPPLFRPRVIPAKLGTDSALFGVLTN